MLFRAFEVLGRGDAGSPKEECRRAEGRGDCEAWVSALRWRCLRWLGKRRSSSWVRRKRGLRCLVVQGEAARGEASFLRLVQHERAFVAGNERAGFAEGRFVVGIDDVVFANLVALGGLEDAFLSVLDRDAHGRNVGGRARVGVEVRGHGRV